MKIFQFSFVFATLLIASLALATNDNPSNELKEISSAQAPALASATKNETSPVAADLDGPISFKNDVMPLLMRGGCNGGGCHGSSMGKDGFKLSLFGFDPEGDFYRLTQEYFGRRINLAAPERSLLLDKVAGRVPHTGGKIFDPESKHYQTLLRWITAGAPRDTEGGAEPVSVSFEPEKINFDSTGQSIQPSVVVKYSDGSTRNIADLAIYMSNNEAIASIDDDAKIEAHQPGGTHVFARFDRFTVGAEVVVLPAGKFDWPDPEEFNYIDSLVNAKLKELRIIPSGLCSDEHFLRRVTIDLTGLLPTPSEYKSFMADTSSNKRENKVDELLGRQEFAELWAAKWGEWLRIITDTNPESGTAMKAGWNYYQWVQDEMLANTPWDEFARELLTGNGSNLRNPASNYYTMLPQGPLEPKKLGEDTAQVFLGLRTQCAQCHNHPFDRWTIDDYYSFTSFFTGLRRKHGTEAREYFTFVDVTAPPAEHLVDGRLMAHRFLGGGLAEVNNKDPREVLAQWMTAPENELFRQNLANRIWDQFFGRGIVHPVDDVRISNPASNAALLEELGRRLAIDYKFDARKLVRDICLSQTYQRSSRTNASNRQDESRFSHASLRRMRADVLFDCLNQALEIQPEFRRSTSDRSVQMFEGGSRDNHNQYFMSTFGQSKRETVCTCETITDANLSQALHLINGNTVNDALTRHPVLVPRLMDELASGEDIIRAIFIRTLCRPPSPEESAGFVEQIPAGTDNKAKQNYYNSVVWALLNSNEFMFNH